MTRLLFAILSAGLIIVGCGSDSEPPSWDLEVICTSGNAIVVDGINMCVYSREIIETGFTCPQRIKHLHEFGNAIVCSDLDTLPDLALGELGDQFPSLVFLPGGEPVHDPRGLYGNVDIDVPGRGAGSCQIGALHASPAQTWTFDAGGKPVQVSTTSGVEESWTYNASGWLATHVKDGKTTVFNRDPFQRATLITESGGGQTRTWAITYGDMNRVSTMVYTDSDGSITRQATYSADGLTRNDPFEICGDRQLTFDTEGKLLRSDLPNCASAGDPLTEFDYDEDGLLTQAWSVSRATGQRENLFQENSYQNGRPVVMRFGGGLNWDPADREGFSPGRLDLTWTNDRISLFEQKQDWDGAIVASATLTGECLFTTRDILQRWMVSGTILR